MAAKPRIQLITKNDKKEKTEEVIHLDEFIDVKGWKSTGNKLTYETFVKFVELPAEDVDEEELEDDEDEMDEIEETPTDDPSDSETKSPQLKKKWRKKILQNYPLKIRRSSLQVIN